MSHPARTTTFGDILGEHARSMPDRLAVVCGDCRLTWAELDARVDRLAGALAADGVGPGDRVLWLGQNCHRVLEGILAAGRIGAIFCPANWRQSPAELAFIIGDFDAKVVFWQETEIGDKVAKARAEESSMARWIHHDGPGEADPGHAGDTEYEAYVASGHVNTRPDVDAESPVLVIYTAAFEGVPNGALLSHRAWLYQNMITAWVQGTTADDVFLCSGPMFHVGTIRHALSAFQLGGCSVVTRRVDAEELCRLIEAEGCTQSFLEQPTMLQMVEVNKNRRYDLTSLRTAPGTREWNAMVTVQVRPLRSGFGQTEVAGLATFVETATPGLGGAGRPSPIAVVEILDAEGEPVPQGIVGEISIRGPLVMNGYHRRPELNERCQRGGWHHTRDLGRRESDGTLSFIGPATRIVKSASENIYPTEVESCLKTHPAVKEAGVIGVPDPVWTQSVFAVVVLSEPGAASAEDLIEHCRKHIASYKKPRFVEFTDALPKLATGGIDYDALDQRYGGGGYPSK